MKFLYPLLAVLLAVFAVAPLEYPGAFQSQTGLLAAYNLINLDQYPLQFFNWAPTVGHAFDLFRTDGALPYVVAEIFHLIGFGYLDAIKIVYALAWIASGLTMYALARQWFSEAGALLAATVYVYLPYHIATVYVRGAFAESVAWAIFPLALLALARRQTVYCSLFTALLFLVQPGVAILFSLGALAIVVALNWRTGSISHSLSLSFSPIAAGLALGALLFAPTMLRHGATIARDGFNANYVLPFQLFSSLWGFGASNGNYLDQFPLQLGVVPIGLAIIAVALGWESSQANARRAVIVFLSVAVVLTLLTFSLAAPIWSVLGIFAAYPWQLLAIVGVALALAAGAAIEFDPRLARPTMLAVLVALPLLASYGYLAPRFVDYAPTRQQIGIFGNDEIALLDYRIVGPLRHGATVRLQLTWQALRLVDHDYTVFVHAVNDDGQTYAQEDAKPQDGALPTIKWQPGQIIFDTHTIQIDVEGPREGYHLQVGLYQAATGDRAVLDVNSSTAQLILPRPGDPEPTITDQVPPKTTP
ncbi:MAG: hypothetical protein KGJ80_03785 [Chloroflexota bacterium]|nr:hypothetical protein [Chloroflexota bacterium]